MVREVVAGVVGAGVFGGHHARKYAALPGVRLAAICDIDAHRAAALAEPLGAAALTDFDEFLDAVEIVTIASPASTHFELARRALERGRHVLVEKPLAIRLDHAERLVALAHARRLVLASGHQERFVFDRFGLCAAARPPRIVRCRRVGPPSARCRDVSVVLDLMIHDIDLLRRLGFGEPAEISARGDDDGVVAALRFENGTLAELEASRKAEHCERRMTFVYDDGTVEIDFVARRVANTSTALAPASFEEAESDPAFRDPLRENVASFVAAVRGEGAPAITGEDGRDALDWALRIEAARGEIARGVSKLARARA